MAKKVKKRRGRKHTKRGRRKHENRKRMKIKSPMIVLASAPNSMVSLHHFIILYTTTAGTIMITNM